MTDKDNRSRYITQFNARKIFDIIDLNKGISLRERKSKIEKLLPFREIFAGYLIDNLSDSVNVSETDKETFTGYLIDN